jgi:hypothetical protein
MPRGKAISVEVVLTDIGPRPLKPISVDFVLNRYRLNNRI